VGGLLLSWPLWTPRTQIIRRHISRRPKSPGNRVRIKCLCTFRTRCRMMSRRLYNRTQRRRAMIVGYARTSTWDQTAAYISPGLSGFKPPSTVNARFETKRATLLGGTPMSAVSQAAAHSCGLPQPSGRLALLHPAKPVTPNRAGSSSRGRRWQSERGYPAWLAPAVPHL
jgi:hypothetical protein